MLGMFKDVKPLVKPKPKILVPRPDNIVFKLHYRVTFGFLIIGSILVSSYAFIDSSGSAIQCMIDKGWPIPPVVINRYCWISSTFTLPKHYEGIPGDDFLHYGVGSHKEEDEKVYHAYYQWVPLMLFFQAIMFYTPHWIWKQIEGGRLKHIIVGLNNHIANDDARGQKVGQLADYLKERRKLSAEHQMWALKFFLCECLNFINVVVQIFLTDAFLGGEFTTYGAAVIKFPYEDPENRVDPMSRVFPKMTKCTFYKYGASGTIQTIDSLCVLGMNVLNEKIYIFLWFWFLILAIITGIALVVRLVQLCSPDARKRFVQLDSMGHLDNDNRKDVQNVVANISYSDWLILYYLAQSMDKDNFKALISRISDDLSNYSNNDEESNSRTGNDDSDEDERDSATLRSPAKLNRFSLKNLSSKSKK